MKQTFYSKFFTPSLMFLFAFLSIVVSHFGILSMMPGDIGDARLNNYFLENIFQFFVGNASSLWHLSFFHPFPYVLGFSDNLFGSAPLYVLARSLGLNVDTSFQLWFLFGYAANFFAAYFALRRLKGSVIAATVGALIFAFALPTTAHAGHAQLHYRFGLPLAIVFFADFLNTKAWRCLLISGAWVLWQFYAGVYIGFFTLLLLATMSLAYFFYALIKAKVSIKNIFIEFTLTWRAQSKYQKTVFFGAMISLLLLLTLLFYPYLQVSHLYGAKRSWDDISIMLPRPQSYFLSDASLLWSDVSTNFSDIPMRPEHQMFIGMVPLALALAGFFSGSRAKNGATFTLMTGMLGIAFVLTLYIGTFSIWYLFHKLPLASAIRAMTRLDQAFLFPIAYLSVIAIDNFRVRYSWSTKVIFALILPLFVTEAAMTSMNTSTKESWRLRVSQLDDFVPKNLPDNSILFFAQHSDPPFADELDAMWVSLLHGKKTMNGYSGFFPPNYDYEFGRDCSQLPKRVLSYLKFSHQADNVAAYRELMSRIVPIGFNNCDPSWLQTPPNITSSDRIYSAKEFKVLSWGLGKIVNYGNQLQVQINIVNDSNRPFSANSSVGKPIRVSWRLIDADGVPMGGWEARKSLSFDIPAHGKSEISFPLDSLQIKNAKAVQVSLVQELVFWAHDIGMQPFTIPIK
jgi:hypothetical protein